MIHPHVFRGLWCRCGAQHHQEASYYVSVIDKFSNVGDANVVLALGPFQEHNDALNRVDAVRTEVLDNWNPGGRAHWYGYGTMAMRPGYQKPGKLNPVLMDESQS